MRWVWIQENVVRAIHHAQLAEHGGGAGFVNEGLLSSALAHPKNLLAYDTIPDVATLAAAYAFAIARNHPFADGNKRTAFVVMELFLELNGYTLQADDAACITAMESVAAGKQTERQLAAWLRERLVKHPRIIGSKS
jgi:death-on-curing protein